MVNRKPQLTGVRATALCIGDGETPPILDGALVLDSAGFIRAVGPAQELQASFAGVEFEPHSAVLMPGLVNAHTHLELSALRGQVPGGRGFVPWLRALREHSRPELDGEAIDAAVSALLRHGTALVGEVSNTLATVPFLATAPFYACVFHELIGVASATVSAIEEGARLAEKRLGTLPDNVAYRRTPHTLFSMHPRLIAGVLDDARTLGQRVSLHLAEHAAERAMIERGDGPMVDFIREAGLNWDWPVPGRSPVHYAEQLGALGPDVIAVHLTDVRADELALVVKYGSPVVLCPRSNLHIEVRLPPLQALLEAGIKPGLGTDSLASCPTLDVLDDARALAQRFPTVKARTLLAMATGYGASALGMADRFGRLAAGLGPGVLAFPHGATPPADPEAFVLAQRGPEDRHWLQMPALAPRQED